MDKFYYWYSKGRIIFLLVPLLCLMGVGLRAQTFNTNIIANPGAESIVTGTAPATLAGGWTDLSDLGFPSDATGATGGVWFLPDNSTYPSPSHGAHQAHSGNFFFNTGISSNPGAGQTAQLEQVIDLVPLGLNNLNVNFSFSGWVATDGLTVCCDGDMVNFIVEYRHGTTVVASYNPQWKAADATDVGWNNLTDAKTFASSDQIDNVRIVLDARNDNGTSTVQAYYDDLSLVATPTTLPVTLVDFHAVREGDGSVQLNWETGQEQNSQFTEIQRSEDGKVFSGIGQVAAAGNSSTVLDYAFTDKAPLEGKNYYRLRMVDIDGSFKYSKILRVAMGDLTETIGVYGNPFHDQVGVRIPAMSAERLVLSLFDQTGRLCLRQNYTTQKGENLVNLYSQGLAAGVYLLQVRGDRTNQTIRVLKQ